MIYSPDSISLTTEQIAYCSASLGTVTGGETRQDRVRG